MHSFVLKIFEFIKSFLHFLKILTLFNIMMLLLYWIQNLTNVSWNWMNFIKPFLSGLVNIGGSITTGSVNLFAAVFEYKYFIALLILLIFYWCCNYLICVTDKIQEKYCDIRNGLHKIQQDKFNNTMATLQRNEQKKIQEYYIYITTALKKKFSHTELNYNIDEQNTKMIKFIEEKTGAMMKPYKDGFLFKYDNFSKIDNVLAVLFKIIKSNQPLDCCINVSLPKEDRDTLFKNIDELNELKILNKISMLPDVVYRYKFNSSHRFGTSQFGIFQKDNHIVEVSVFEEI